ncbi:Tyrosyl-tRNA synthetase [Giardia lamblia P15]|uniref:tyrosine--tRNA ligase n=1 Tax=Giardia intestinalis (strain P15) TaxID=658858 RepID=E1EYV3_GIAIA|nr:Tyrosyl-tRNA synthetase [Giardia lamblia P15]
MATLTTLPPLTPAQKQHLLEKLADDIMCPEELHALLHADESKRLTCYDGFEPSGRIHIAQGIAKAINVNRLLRSGIDCVFYVADWFAALNNKCDAELSKIQTLGRYFVEVWKACGMLGVSKPVVFSTGQTASVRFVWASEFIRQNSSSYWMRVMNIARSFTVPRMQRCSTIMGRTEGDDQPISQILYPSMQCADIFELKLDMVEMGLDQRKVNALARDYCDKSAELKYHKPVILMHHMLLGLVGDGKMSKSVPDSAIYMDDSFEEIQRKIMNASCPEPGAEDGNPILEYYKYIVFGAIEQEMVSIECSGSSVILPYDRDNNVVEFSQFANYEGLEAAYAEGRITPHVLKSSLVHYIDSLIAPVRTHFESTPELSRLLSDVHSIRSIR